jgi:Mg2+ and Co2+ transporter CorA
LVLEADKALSVLREDGTAVAMPEAVLEVRQDMETVALRLSQIQTDELTQGIEQDIIAALEEMIEALEKAQDELEQKKNDQQQQPGQQGEPEEPPLVDQLAELKMIRSLQMRINRRTQTYSRLVDGEQTSRPELLDALQQLAERQERLERSTRDIATEKNK